MTYNEWRMTNPVLLLLLFTMVTAYLVACNDDSQSNSDDNDTGSDTGSNNGDDDDDDDDNNNNDDTGSDADSDADGDSDADADSDSDTDGDTDSDSDADTDSDADGDTDSDADGDTDSDVNAVIDFGQTHPISPLIYGFNQDHQALDGPENWASRRLGGNRMTVFNWENGASNSGHDNAQYPNDNRIPSLVGVPWADKDKSGEAYRVFHQNNLDAGITSIITVPILGWVAADKDGSNLTSPPSERWDQLIYEKPTDFSLTPDPNDGVVYLDESINYLVQTFGDATTETGVKYIALDNEPALWETTHNKVQTTLPAAADYVQNVISAAKAIKKVDPNVNIIAGEFAGINIYDFGNPPDWGTVGNGYDWFLSYFLDELKKASDIHGSRLVDIISIHNYPQHKIDSTGAFDGENGTIVLNSTSTEPHIRTARMNFPRSLWDDSYIEPSWLTDTKLNGEPNKILLRLQNAIDTYFPETKMMIGEFDHGHDTNISHGIALVDFLGVVSQNNVQICNRWDRVNDDTDVYTEAAYRLFRNYDGTGATYGDTSVNSKFDSIDQGSVWASTNSNTNDLHLILINKDLTTELSFGVFFKNSDAEYSFKTLTILNANSTTLVTGDDTGLTINSDTITTSVPPMTAYHLVLARAN